MKKFKIDFFSDTNTNPSPAMRKAMCEAEVGNEVAGEDPTVNKLLERVCELLGKEAAVFLPSGTMCNGIAFRVLCQRPGDLIILDETAHPLMKAGGLIAGLVQAQPYCVQGARGIFSAEQVEPILSRPPGYNLSRARVVSIEQTTNLGGGAIWPLKTIEEVCTLAHQQGAYTHMDGARLWDAMVETDIAVSRYAKHFDSVWVDFCKNLGAPMGAVLAGSRAFCDEAWYYKFQQGGGLHQAGILAAACLYGLEHNLPRLLEIHEHARHLAHALQHLDYIDIDPDSVQTNIVIVGIKHVKLSAFDFERALALEGIRVLALDAAHLRMITHLDISKENILQTVLAFKTIAKGFK